MPFPDELIMFEGQNKLVPNELSYDIEEILLALRILLALAFALGRI